MDARFTALRSTRLFRTYSIGQLCREFAVTPRAVRFYEAQGLISPARDGPARVFSYRDRARLMLVVNGRRVGLAIADIRSILEAYDHEGEEAQSALALKVFRKRLAVLEAERLQVDAAIGELRLACRRMGTPDEPVVRPPPATRQPEAALAP